MTGLGFIASSWRITSHAMFAGSCIGVIILVICLEFLRRLSKEYDRYILRCFRQDLIMREGLSSSLSSSSSSYNLAQQGKVVIASRATMMNETNSSNTCCSNTDGTDHQDQQQQQQHKPNGANLTTTAISPPPTTASTTYFRPSLTQQSIRALLHMVTFAVAYFVMLLAMYYNGYFIICIFIGAYIGAFVFTWESISVSTGYARPSFPFPNFSTQVC